MFIEIKGEYLKNICVFMHNQENSKDFSVVVSLKDIHLIYFQRADNTIIIHHHNKAIDRFEFINANTYEHNKSEIKNKLAFLNIQYEPRFVEKPISMSRECQELYGKIGD